jgi:hypothetical protein
MALPNFLLIGAAKAGTTALYHYLSQHPDVYLSPVKEPKYFALRGTELSEAAMADPVSLQRYRSMAGRRGFITTLQDYEALFAATNGQKARGEASGYLYSEQAPGLIRETLPNVRLFAILRQPVERAYSHYLHRRRDGLEPLANFGAALRQEPYTAVDDFWLGDRHYIRPGLYYHRLRRYFDLFPREQIRIYLYDDLKAGADKLVRDVFSFIGVDPSIPLDTSVRHNKSGIPKNRLLHRMLSTYNPLARAGRLLVPQKARRRLVNALKERNLEQPPLPEDVKREWTAFYRDDILRLQDLIGRDLSTWLG